ncbi:hypothetical protein HB943_03460 [Listeria weihenstephanensis]|uniref:Uncharacterized protein n=1 Tax=Listeria weihenstephanensis TaxID=1006155 RepID=A0A841Z368_9LIST|nr:hypothetical protein [Listeria weihenstephanensis]MBC1499648.1 hypothetical protein [Listeria weihenstephanensis]
MENISVGKSFELYLDTLSQCGEETLKLADIEVEHLILEEFIIGATAFFSKYTLERLEENGIIDAEISEKSKLLQRKIMEFDGTELWNVHSIRSASEWANIILLSDEIKNKINQKWTTEEIEYLYSIS